MILYLLLCVFAILVTVIALGIAIAGIINKKRTLWISSLSIFVVCALFSVFSVVTYIKKSIDYMGSDEFQEETKRSASNWGKNIGNTVSGAAEGLEETLDEDVINKLAEKSGIILGGGVKALSKGASNTGNKAVHVDKEMEKYGIEIGHAELLENSKKTSFGLYLEFKKDFKGKLRLTAFDMEGKKIDNSTIELDQKLDQDEVFEFEFKYLKPINCEYLILSTINLTKDKKE